MPRGVRASDGAVSRGQSTIKLTERFDYGALCYIIRSFDEFTFRPGTDTAETLSMLQRYKAASQTDGSRSVTYRQVGAQGRYFADRGLSLQAISKKVRNAIAYPFYEDLDFVNCHPALHFFKRP